MFRRSRLPLSIFVIYLWLGPCWAAIAGTQEIDEGSEAELWTKLAGDDAESTHAILKLSREPKLALKLCKKELTPLKLDESSLDELISQLGSLDVPTWTNAYQRLSYQDPRLFGNVSEVLQRVETEPARGRMIGVLDFTPKQEILDRGGTKGSNITFHAVDENFEEVIFSRPGLGWSVDCRIESMIKGKPSWQRAMRALLLLEAMGNVEAEELVLLMADGHPKAAPTILATEIVERLSQDKRSSTVTQDELQQWWNDLAIPGLKSTRAILSFARFPNESTKFFAEQLKPLLLDEARLKKLMEDLASDDDDTWQEAYRQLEYFDPRLAQEIPAIFKDTEEAQLKKRLVAVLSGWSLDDITNPDTYYGNLVITENEFVVYSVGESWNFRAGGGSWEASELKLLGGRLRKIKPQWDRAMRALAILDQIGSAESLEIVREMSTGNPDAAPTKIALEMLNSR